VSQSPNESQLPNEPDAREIAALEALERDIVECRLRWWHLLWWARSPVRPLERRFRECDRAVLEAIGTGTRSASRTSKTSLRLIDWISVPS